jgi:hypothetical protein
MKIRIGNLTILWGDPLDLLEEEFKGRVKYNALMKNLKAALKKSEEEEKEPECINEVKALLHQGNTLMALKVYMMATGKGLRESKEDVVRIKDKMEIDAKNE